MDRLDVKRVEYRELLDDVRARLAASQIMTQAPSCITPETSALDLVRMLHQKQFRHLLVTDPQGKTGTDTVEIVVTGGGNQAPVDISNRSARTHLCARLRGSLRLIPIEEVHYLQAEEKYVVVHHVRGEDLIEESLKSLEEEFSGRFVRIHRNCLVARHELVELRRVGDGHVQAILRHGKEPLEVSRRCVAGLRETVKNL